MQVQFEDAYRSGWIAGNDCASTSPRSDEPAGPHNPFRDPVQALWWRWGFSNGREEYKDVLVN